MISDEQIDAIREHQRKWKSENDQAESDTERGRYCINHGWLMYHSIDSLIETIRELQAENAALGMEKKQ